ncbi:MAG: TonB-dependent receptor [Bryobacterales bacterium]|nr:TonB-dependent receptor [Bryobacterales bacterium]
MPLPRVTAILFWALTLPAAIRLEVRDPSGAPVDARLTLRHLDSGRQAQANSGPQGVYNNPDLPAGRYRLVVSREGFATHSASLEVPAQGSSERTITLILGAPSYALDVVSPTPLEGLGLASSELPAPVQTATAIDLRDSGALDLADFLNRRMNGVYLNEIQANPLQPDLNYRGYTASPLLGTPQGVSIYFDGVRMNQPFGEVVSWDLIPRAAIAEATLLPGSNPLFGLNTLGGAVSLRAKDGRSHPGTSLQLSGGSFGRKMADLEHGGSHANGLHWHGASTLLFEDGWRESSPSAMRQFSGKLGWQRDRTALGLTLSYANNGLIGNGLQEFRLLERDRSSVYTKPDQTANRSPFLAWSARRELTPRVTFSGLVYFRYIRTRTLNGDINEESLDQSVYQPNADESAALAAAGYSGFPLAGETSANTPFPRWRCIANVLLGDEPSEKCNGLLNRSSTHQRNYGASGQFTWNAQRGGVRHQLTAGAAYDGSRAGFSQSSELGYLNPDRSITGLAAFGDGVTGGDADGEPYDTRVELASRTHNASLFATDTLTASRATVTLSGRFNRTIIDNRDQLIPRPGTGSLTGRHTFQRFNPAAGLTFRAHHRVSAYASYSEGSRAPSSIELGCADPESPCKLPNSMAGDPPLRQVVTRTFEAGARSSSEDRLRWSAGYFFTANRDDILFVASEQTGFGYFKNFGRTRRQGLELDASFRWGRLLAGGGYTLLDATFRSAELVNGTGNSTNEEAEDGIPGQEAPIEIEPGNQIPLTPRHLVKLYADVAATSRLLINAGVVGISQSFARGNENNLHEPDGRYYVGPGVAPGYAVVNLGARYRLSTRLQLFFQINNLFDRQYVTGAQLGPTGFTPEGAFVARPFPAIAGEFPVRQSTFFANGAPRAGWLGLRLSF